MVHWFLTCGQVNAWGHARDLTANRFQTADRGHGRRSYRCHVLFRNRLVMVRLSLCLIA